MKKHKHPRHDAWFTELSLGSSSWSSIDGSTGDAQAIAVMDKAWEAGIRYFDTAPYYGSGLCERRLASALNWKPRADYLLSTKVGVDLDPFARRQAVERHYPYYAEFSPVCDYSRDGIWKSYETSLHRLGTIRADIAFMHGISICPGGLEAALATGMPALLELREAGYVRMVGVGANTPQIAMSFIERYDIDVLLFAGGFSLIDHQEAGLVVRECERRKIAILAASPFASGRYFSPANDGFRAKVAAICERYGVSENAPVIQFGLKSPATVSVLWSTTKAENVVKTIAAINEPVPDALWQDLIEQRLLYL